jgi:lysozyme
MKKELLLALCVFFGCKDSEQCVKLDEIVAKAIKLRKANNIEKEEIPARIVEHSHIFTSTEIYNITAWLIKSHENFSPKPYLCAAKKWTIGWGRLCSKNEKITTLEKENELFKLTLQKQFDEVYELYPHLKNNVRVAAVVSFAYNVSGGINSVKNKSLGKALDKKQYKIAAKSILRYNKVHRNTKVIVVDGLTKRREKEAHILINGMNVSEYKALKGSVIDIINDNK